MPYKEKDQGALRPYGQQKLPSKPTCCTLRLALCCPGLCAATSVQVCVSLFPRLCWSPWSLLLTHSFICSLSLWVLAKSQERNGAWGHKAFLAPSLSCADCWIIPEIGYNSSPFSPFQSGRIFLFQLGNLMSESSIWQRLSSSETPCLLISSSVRFHMSKHFNGIWFQGGILQMREN